MIFGEMPIATKNCDLAVLTSTSQAPPAFTSQCITSSKLAAPHIHSEQVKK